MDRQGRVVRLDHRVGHLRRRHHRERAHYPVGILLANLGDEESAHAGTGTTAQRVSQLKSLQAVATLCFLPHHVEHRVDQFSTLGVVSLRPVVARAGLPEHEIVRPEDVTKRARAHRVHRAGLQVDEDRAWHVHSTGRLVVVHVDPLQLQVRVSVVGAGRIDAMLVRDHLPELTIRQPLSSVRADKMGLLEILTWIVNDERDHGRLVDRFTDRPIAAEKNPISIIFSYELTTCRFRGCDTDLGTDLVATLSGLYVHDLPHLRIVRGRRNVNRNFNNSQTAETSTKMVVVVVRGSVTSRFDDVDPNGRDCRMRFAQTETDERLSHLGDARSRSNRDPIRHTSRLYFRFYSRSALTASSFDRSQPIDQLRFAQLPQTERKRNK